MRSSEREVVNLCAARGAARKEIPERMRLVRLPQAILTAGNHIRYFEKGKIALLSAIIRRTLRSHLGNVSKKEGR